MLNVQLCGRTHFYTNMRPGGFARQQGGQGGGGQQSSSPMAQLLAFLPVLLLLAFTFFSSQSEPVRSWQSELNCCCVSAGHTK